MHVYVYIYVYIHIHAHIKKYIYIYITPGAPSRAAPRPPASSVSPSTPATKTSRGSV